MADSKEGGPRSSRRLCRGQPAAPCFSFNDTAATEIYPRSLNDAVPICQELGRLSSRGISGGDEKSCNQEDSRQSEPWSPQPDKDRKSTRLNSSHSQISYAVFCLKKKKRITGTIDRAV